ncbi:MAG TPA: tetratricopeptide repeat protein [Candidatus Avelusimicrobium excrementipullorum]|nr:tetratricopeptide repeat protein [Candidatus Avelusimicrobium excrementipullorum]
MNNKLKILCLGGLGLFLSGCLASERDMGTLKLQLKELNETIALMQTNQAELASKMEELNQNLAVSNENLSQLDGQLFNLSSKLDDINAVVTGGQGAAGAGAVMLPSDVFNEAKNHLTKQSYDLAVTGFKLYIEKYPDGENIQQAYIYLGDAYAALGQARPAAIAYATVLQKFPESKIIPTARLKYARSIIPLGKTEEAKRYFNSVVQDFGSSPEARLAKEELAKLK